MSRWAWHEKNGVRNGPVRRKSDYLSAEEEECVEHERHEREYDWIEHHPDGEPMFQPTRICYKCNDEKSQHDMHWVGKSWLCPSCHASDPNVHSRQL